MKTRFYKILYNNQDVVYVGVTTRTIQKRFYEHIKSKHLDINQYSVIQFDEIEHPSISSIDEYYSEYRKIKELEQKYIQEEKDRGSNLLNISVGGEWGSDILHNILKEQFFEIYGSYDGFKKWLNKKRKTKIWLYHWLFVRATNPTKKWIKAWYFFSSADKFKLWLGNWIRKNKDNRTYCWIKHWTSDRKINRTKYWIKHWIGERKINRTKYWIKHWILRRKNTSKTKQWIRGWVTNKSVSKTKQWVSSWYHNKNKNKTKSWFRCWVAHRK